MTALAWTSADLNIGWRKEQTDYRKVILFVTNTLNNPHGSIFHPQGRTPSREDGADTLAEMCKKKWDVAKAALKNNGVLVIYGLFNVWSDAGNYWKEIFGEHLDLPIPF